MTGNITYVDESAAAGWERTLYAFLAENDVRPFSDLPMWMVPEGRTAGFMRMSASPERPTSWST